MITLRARFRRGLLVAGCVATLSPLAGCAAPASRTGPSSARETRPAPPVRATGTARESGAAPGPVTADPAAAVGRLASAEKVLGHGGASPAVTAREALNVQVACLRLAGRPAQARAALKRMAPSQRAAAAGDIAAIVDLAALASPTDQLPRWRIVPPEPLAALRADYRAAQAATGVGWQYLAAVNFVETDFGRIAGLSGAGAEGPMQFMPATWAAYGRGDVHRPRDAIFGAARFLADRGAPGDMDSALRAYNPSRRYADAVQRYAARLRADPAALAGYYDRQVTYRLTRGWVLLPPGYGVNQSVRPVPIRT